MINRETHKTLIEIILICLFVLNLLTTSISNYTFNNFLLKLGALLLFAIFSVIYIKLNREKLLDLFNDSKLLKTINLLFVFSAATGLTLFYSYNQPYGFIKWVNLTFSTVPFVLLSVINYKIFFPYKINMILIVFGIFSLLMSFFIIIIFPFDYSGIQYQIDITRWSHVVSGRLLSLFVMASMLCIIFMGKPRLKNFNYFVFIISGYALYITGLRAALLGFIILIPLIFLIMFSTKRYLKNALPFFISLLIIFIIIYMFPVEKSKAEARLNNLTQIENLNFGNDGAIQARLKGWKIAYEMYIDNPIFGVGIGGYNQFYNTELPKLIKYPHNLFVELIVEYGIPGIAVCVLILIIVTTLLLQIIRTDPKISYTGYCLLTTIFLLLILFLWLAMFSKDVTTQNLLYLTLAFYYFKRMSQKE